MGTHFPKPPHHAYCATTGLFHATFCRPACCSSTVLLWCNDEPLALACFSSRTALLQTLSQGLARHIWSSVPMLYTVTAHVRACGYLGGITQRLLNVFMHRERYRRNKRGKSRCVNCGSNLSISLSVQNPTRPSYWHM